MSDVAQPTGAQLVDEVAVRDSEVVGVRFDHVQTERRERGDDRGRRAARVDGAAGRFALGSDVDHSGRGVGAGEIGGDLYGGRVVVESAGGEDRGVLTIE